MDTELVLKCQRCSTKNKKNVKFCKECGVPMKNIDCKCGAIVGAGNRYCTECGMSVTRIDINYIVEG